MPEEWNLKTSDRAVLIAMAFSGFAVGAAVGGFIGDFYGRRPLLILHSSIFIPMSVLSGLSRTFAELLVLRFIVGTSLGKGFRISGTNCPHLGKDEQQSWQKNLACGAKLMILFKSLMCVSILQIYLIFLPNPPFFLFFSSKPPTSSNYFTNYS